MGYYVEVLAESRTKKPVNLDVIKNKLTRYSGLNWIHNPYRQNVLCVKFLVDSIFHKKILPSIARIESQSKVDVIVLTFEP